MQFILFELVLYFLLISILFIERFYRYGEQASSLDSTEYDRGTTKLVSYGFVISLLLLFSGIILNYIQLGILTPEFIFIIIGIIGMITGIFLRLYAVKSLGKYYTAMLKTTSNQILIDKGIYRFIRHPGYLGNIILLISTAIAINNTISVIIVTILIVSVYLKRIDSEELMLSKNFGETYDNYKSRSKKLIPFIF